MLYIDEEVKNVLDIINNSGYEAYIVGGYVRDLLLGKHSFDVDITTSAKPNEVIDIFKEYDIQECFSNLGSVKFTTSNYSIEITTYRKEYDYENHRKPSKIEFIDSLDEDLSRRDFTINALCYKNDKLVDLYGGLIDLDKKIIRTIGNPLIRLEEDALRILRALRFAVKLNFKIDEDLKQAIYSNLNYLKEVSFETKYRELKGILEGECSYILEEYKKVFMDIFELNDLRLDLLSDNYSFEEKEALFFYYSSINIKNKYLLNKDLVFSLDRYELKKLMSVYGKDNIFNLLYFNNKIFKKYEDVTSLANSIIEGNECFNLSMLEINGKDLLNLGYEGITIGKLLDKLLDAVMKDECLNNKEDLLKYLEGIE